MSSDWIPAVSAIIGAVIGAAATAIPAYYQMKVQARTQRITEAMRLGLEYHKTTVAQMRETHKRTVVAPADVMVFMFAELARELEQGPVTAERIAAFHRRQGELTKALHDQFQDETV